MILPRRFPARPASLPLQRLRAVPLLLAALLVNACGGGGGGGGDSSGAITATPATPTEFRLSTVASGLEKPWSLAWLPDGRMLVSEKPGRLRLLGADGTRIGEPLAGLPEVEAVDQGGLLDVVLHPDFASNRLVYWSYAEPGSGADEGRSGTAVARGRLSDDERRIENVQVIFRQVPKVSDTTHYGSRLVFARDGRLFVTLGDRRVREAAQDLSNHLGKIVRLEADGRVPADNPFVGRAGARPEIWSYGHRNVQGAALHPETGELWVTEHGPQGGDELNIVRAGRNYGWPRVTTGCEYQTCEPIGSRDNLPGMEAPVIDWTPQAIAPSGLAFYTGTRLPQWRGQLFAGGLISRSVWRLELQGDQVSQRESLFSGEVERIRDVRQGPDGRLYLLTDSNNARLLRVDP